MIRTSEFLAAFRQPSEDLHLRAFKPKKALPAPDNEALTWDTKLADLTSNQELQRALKTANLTRGIFFAPNVGGGTDDSITRITSFFVENDSLPLEEQHKKLDEAPIQPSIRNETRKSVHGYYLIAGECDREQWVDIQLRLIRAFDGDPKIKNLSRVMRLPNFDHLHSNGNGLERKRVVVHTFEPSRRYTAAEMRGAFPAPLPENVPQGQPALTIGPFECHEDRHAELCQRIMARGRRNSKGNWDAKGRCHNGTGEKGLVYFPITGAVKCNADPGCDYFTILRAETLPDGHLPLRDSKTNQTRTDKHTGSQSEPADQALEIVKMAHVEAENVSWLWEPYIALGKLTLLEGDPGIGKSWITAALAAAVSCGRGLSGMGITEPANVLMCTAEDGLADYLAAALGCSGR